MAALASDWLRHFRLHLWNRRTEFNETWQEARSKRLLPSLCFWVHRKNKMAALASDWLRHFRLLLWNCWMEFIATWKGSKISSSSTKFVFFRPIGKTRWPPWPLIGWDIFDFSSETAEWNSSQLEREARSHHPLPSLLLVFLGPSEKQDGRPGLWLAETFSTSPLKLLNGIHRNLKGKQDLIILYQVCVFQADRKNKMAALASDLPRHFRLLLWNHWTEFNKTWQEARSQHPLPCLCFRADRKNKMAALASDWLRHFWLLLWNRWTEFNETWQEARPQRPLPSLCFSGWSEKQDGRPGLWLAETFSTSPLKPLNRIQRNLTGSKISTSSTKFVFFGPIGKQKGLPWQIPQKGGTLYSGARYMALWASCLLMTRSLGCA